MPNRLTVLFTSNPQMDGRHYRELRYLDEDGLNQIPGTQLVGQMSEQQAENLQNFLDKVIAEEREDAVSFYIAEDAAGSERD